MEPLITDTSNKERKSYSPNRLHTVPDKSLDELQLTYTSYNGQNLNSPAVSVIRGSTQPLITGSNTTVKKDNSVQKHIDKYVSDTAMIRYTSEDDHLIDGKKQPEYLNMHSVE